MILTDFLTQIADSIRSKDGTAEPILATDFPQRILDLPTGGSDIKVATGTIVVAEDRRIVWNQYSDVSFAIEHGLGVVPNFALVFDADYIDADTYPAYSGAFVSILDVGLIPYRSALLTRTNSATGGAAIDVISNLANPDARFTDTVYRFGNGNGCYILAGRTYNWIIGRI